MLFPLCIESHSHCKSYKNKIFKQEKDSRADMIDEVTIIISSRGLLVTILGIKLYPTHRKIK
jgi:hypothetical protein